jgi:hypothetical protein
LSKINMKFMAEVSEKLMYSITSSCFCSIKTSLKRSQNF